MKIEYFSGNQRLQTPDVLWITQPVGDNYCELARNTGEKDIRFCGNMVARLPSSDTHINLKVVDRTLYDRADFIKREPFLGVPLDSREFAEVHVFISISGAPLFCSAARFFAIADILAFHHMNFGASPFFPVSPAFFVTMPEMFHGKGRVIGAGGITVKVISDFRESAFVAYIIGDQCLGKMKFIFQEAISFDGVKSSVSEKSIWLKVRVEGEVVSQDRLKGSGIRDGLVLVRGV